MNELFNGGVVEMDGVEGHDYILNLKFGYKGIKS
jgi:hypothetical protein